jgi:hypothetical protein
VYRKRVRADHEESSSFGDERRQDISVVVVHQTAGLLLA